MKHTFWAHLNTFSDMGHYIMELTLYHVFKVWFADVHRFHGVFWQGHISVHPFLAQDRFWCGHLIMKTQLKTSTECVPVGQKWSNHRSHLEWDYISSISWTYVCSGDFQRQAFSLFCAWVHIYLQRFAAWVSPVQCCAWHHLNCMWEINNHRSECFQ